MPNRETIRTLPPRWADDSLSESMGNAFSHTLAAFVKKKTEYAHLVGIDDAFITACKNLSNPQDVLAAIFLMRTHSGFRAACQLAMNGQIAESFPILRVCLEHSLYALLINKTPKIEGEPDLGEM